MHLTTDDHFFLDYDDWGGPDPQERNENVSSEDVCLSGDIMTAICPGMYYLENLLSDETAQVRVES